MFSLTTWKKYLQEKYRTTKEKAAWARAWAWKHEGNLNTYKGFYIPSTLPQTEQGKFFQKKRTEDEERLRDLNLKKGKFLSSFTREVASELLDEEKSFKDLREEKMFGFLKTSESYKFDLANNSKIFNKTFSFKCFKWSKKLNFFFFKFSKKFLKSPFLPIMVQERQHLWSYLNMGQNTNQFLNFFFIQYFPAFFINFNFLKNKILLVKQYNKISLSSNFLEKLCIRWNLFINFLNFFLKKKNVNFLSLPLINNFYFFNKIFSNWKVQYTKQIIFKEFLLDFLLWFCLQNLTSKLLYYFISIIYTNLFNSGVAKNFLNQIFLTRVLGSLNFFILKKKNRKKSNYQVNYLLDRINFFSNLDKLKLIQLLFLNKKISKNIFCSEEGFDFVGLFYLMEICFLNYDIFSFNRTLITRSLSFYFLENFVNNSNAIKNVFPLGWGLTKTFFVFLKKWIKTYEMIWFFTYTSFSQQVKLVDKFNVPDIFFWYIIWKGKKLTARTVFLKFLKKFKKKYNLPGLAVFAHAMLFIEPKVWLKEKKMAGRVYEIPIYISSSWSKWIAIRWLLQAAKKRKWASIVDSLAQEVWDACFKRGAAFNNKETVQQTVKRNKAYLRWL